MGKQKHNVQKPSHRVFNKLTPPVGVRDIGSCQPLLCHSFWLLAGRRSGFFIPPNPLPLCLLGFDVDRSLFLAYFLGALTFTGLRESYLF